MDVAIQEMLAFQVRNELCLVGVNWRESVKISVGMNMTAVVVVGGNKDVADRCLLLKRNI